MKVLAFGHEDAFVVRRKCFRWRMKVLHSFVALKAFSYIYRCKGSTSIEVRGF